jgi:hypothetical protein
VPLLLLSAFAAGLWLGWGSAARRSPWAVPAAFAAALLPVALLLAAMSVRGPLHAWFLFWTAPAFRMVFVTLLVTSLLWSLYALFAVGRSLTGRAGTSSGGVLVAAGVSLLALSAVLPSTAAALGALHSPLALLPLTFAVVLGILTYLGAPPALAHYAAAAGALLIAVGHVMGRREPVTGDPKAPAAPGPGQA